MTRAALRSVPETLSPERAALADAIAATAPLRVAADAARAKAEAARGAMADAHAAVPVAERAVEDAKARLVEDPHASRAELRSARQAAVDAADDLSIACEASARADAAEVETVRSARYAAERVEAAADAVVAASYRTALEVAQRAGREAASSAFVAEAVATFADPWNGERSRREGEAAALNGRIRFGGSELSDVEAARQAAQAPWRAARASLLIDSAAPLPAL